MTPDIPARDPHRAAPRGLRKRPRRAFSAALVLAAALAFGQSAPGIRAQDLQAGSDTVSADFEAERMLSSILRSAPGGIGVVVDRVIVQVNEYILQLTGYSREELIGRSARVFYPTDEDYEYVGREKYRQISETGTGTVETRWITKDGRLLDVILSSTPLDASDLGAGVVFTVTDVTEKNSTARALRSRNRDFLIGMTIFLILQLILIAALARTSTVRHRTTEELRAKTEELDRYFSSSLDLLCIADTSGRFIRLNPEWEKVLGYPIPELEGRKFLDLVHPEDLPGTLDAISRLDAQEAVLNFTNRYLCRDGTYRWIEWRSRPVGSTIYAAARDITDRMDTEARLRLSEERFDLAMLAVNDGIWDWDVPSGVVYFDARYYTISGYEPDEFPHKFEEFQNRVHPDDVESVLAAAREHLAGRTPVFDIEFRFLRKDGTWMWIRGRGRVVARDGDGNVLRMIGTHTDVTDKKAAEEELQQANLVIENSPAVLFRWKAQEGWPTLLVTENVSQFGYARDELLSGNIPFSTLVHPEDLARVAQEVRRNTDQGLDRFEQVYRVVTRDGSVRWVDDRTKVIRDGEGRAVEYQGVLFDITDRKKAEAELERSLNFQSALLDAVPTAVFYKDREGRYQGCNKVFTEIMGVTSEAIRGRTVQELWPSGMADTYHRKDLDLMASPVRQTYEYMVKDLNGLERPVIFTKDVFRDEKGEVAGIVGAFLDITDRRRAEEELKALNETLEQRIRDRTRELDEMNAHLVKANEELQTTLETLHEAQDSLVQSEKLAALGQLIAGIAHELNTPLGAIVSSNQSMIRLLGSRLQDASRALAGLSQDVLDWFNPALEAALGASSLSEEPSGRYRRRKALAARLSEGGASPSDSLIEALLDLRLDEDPSIPGLARNHPDFEKAVDALDTLASIKSMSDVISVAADKCSNVVSALLYYVRREDGEEGTSRVDVVRELESLLTLYSNKTKYGVRIEKEYRCPGSVRGNRNQLNQVWMNLIQNALQAMDFQGTLGLGVDRVDAKIVVSVRDTGPGVPEHLRKKIFEPFFTTKKSGEGTGLGLDICRKIVERHGGRIELESEPGATIFRVFLPEWEGPEEA